MKKPKPVWLVERSSGEQWIAKTRARARELAWFWKGTVTKYVPAPPPKRRKAKR